MILTTTDEIVGKKVAKTLGLVKGSTIRARHMGSDIIAGLKNVIGGELKGYTKLINDARNEATDRMKEDAEKMKKALEDAGAKGPRGDGNSEAPEGAPRGSRPDPVLAPGGPRGGAAGLR